MIKKVNFQISSWPIYVKIGLIIILPLLIFSCSKNNSNHEDLKKYVKDLNNKPVQAIEPIPEIKSQSLPSYAMEQARSPFSATKKLTTSKQKDKSTLQELELYPVDALALVGTLADRSTIWALIQVPTGNIYKATIGQRIGTHQGQITEITKNYLKIIELVPDQNQKNTVKQQFELPLQNANNGTSTGNKK